MKCFNTTGICHPEDNFMVDISDKLDLILKLIYQKKYFVINRPRQYGKTTTMFMLENRLLESEDYLPVFISFEGLDDSVYENPKVFALKFLSLLGGAYKIEACGYSNLFYEAKEHVNDFYTLSKVLKEILLKIDKKIVLLIDEVDKSSDNRIFLHFLGLLRDKYLKAQRRQDVTFHSVILAGVTDIKNLKLKIRPEEAKTLNSPWNIAIDFTIDMSFNPEEIQTMLLDYTKEKDIQMDIKSISERLYFWTSGYPFLVSKLCLMIDEDLLPNRDNKTWELEDIDKVANLLQRVRNTLFDDIAKNLENNQSLYKLIEKIVLGNHDEVFNNMNLNMSIAYQYGIIDYNQDGKIKIHNKIFEEAITSYFVSNISDKKSYIFDGIHALFVRDDDSLDFDKIMLKFQEAIKEKYSGSDAFKSDEFLENELRLLFLIYLKPIINGYGFTFKEVQTGAEKRLDIVVVFNKEKFVVELKLWRGTEAHSRGLAQLKTYMQAESVAKGYMLIMNKNKNREFKHWVEDDILCVMV